MQTDGKWTDVFWIGDGSRWLDPKTDQNWVTDWNFLKSKIDQMVRVQMVHHANFDPWTHHKPATKRMFGGAQDKDGWTDSHLDPGASRGRCLTAVISSRYAVPLSTGQAMLHRSSESGLSVSDLFAFGHLAVLMMFHCCNKSVVVGHSWLVYVGLVLDVLNVVQPAVSPNLGWWIWWI